MEAVLSIARALSDEQRLRALLMLRGGELCVCQVIDALGLAPSTVSKHMSILHDAGLVRRRKEGKWHYYRLAGRAAPPEVRRALAWVSECVGDPTVAAGPCDPACCAPKSREKAAACYRA